MKPCPREGRRLHQQCFPPAGTVGVVDDRHLRLRQQHIAAGARRLVVGELPPAAAERVDRDDDERRRGHQCRRKHAPARAGTPRRGIPGGHGPGTVADDGPASRDRSQADSENRNAVSSAAPAPKNAAACAARTDESGRQRGQRQQSGDCAPRRDAVDRCRPAARSNARRAAPADSAATPPAATAARRERRDHAARNPTARLACLTCSSSSVVPTAPTHQVLRPSTTSAA